LGKVQWECDEEDGGAVNITSFFAGAGDKVCLYTSVLSFLCFCILVEIVSNCLSVFVCVRSSLFSCFCVVCAWLS